MLAKRDIYLVLVIALLSIFVGWWASLGYPSEGQVCEWAKDGYQPPCTPHNFIVAVIYNTVLWVDKFHDVLIVFGTFTLAAVVVVQISEGRKSSERQLRAYVHVTEA